MVKKTPRPSMAKAVRAKCADCMGFFKDGRKDCEVTCCSLYYWQPYRKLEPDTRWLAKRERHTGPAPDIASYAQEGQTAAFAGDGAAE